MANSRGRIRKPWLPGGGAVALLAAATCVAGEVGQRPIAVQGFDRVVWSAAGELRIVQGAAEALRVEAERRLLPKVSAVVSSGTLYIGFNAGRIATQEPIRFDLMVKTLTGLESRSGGDFSIGALSTPTLTLKLGGSDELRIGQLSTEQLNVSLAGAGSVEIERGTATTQRIDISGSGSYVAAGLDSRTTSVSISGSGDAEVMATGELVAQIPGAGQIRYAGNPTVKQRIDGAGQVVRID